MTAGPTCSAADPRDRAALAAGADRRPGGPDDFQVNKTAELAGITADKTAATGG